MYTYRLILEFQHQRGTLHKLCPVRPPQHGDQSRHGYSHPRPPFAVYLAPSAKCYAENLGDFDVSVRRIVRRSIHGLRIGTLTDRPLSVCIVSLIRLVILLQTDFTSLDLSWSIADFSMWCTVEACFAIISGKYLHHRFALRSDTHFPASLPLLRPIYKASTSYVSCLYKRSTLSLSQSSKSFGASSRKDTASMEEDTLPMHSFQIYEGKPVQGHEGPIRIESEASIVYEPRTQIETRRNALEQGKC